MTRFLTYETWDPLKVEETENRFKDSLDVIKWAYETFQDELLYACSFGVEGIVLTDLIARVEPRAEIVFLDTGLHFQQTIELIKKVKKKYPLLRIRQEKPELSLAEQNARYGEELWKQNPHLCCHLRKIVPLKRALHGKKAWITGLRRMQSETRNQIRFINKDDRFEKIKICPLKDWTWDDVWLYVRLHDLPYNDLHDNGYPSIGCAPCTLPVKDGEDLRAGRWAHTNKTECGLHVPAHQKSLSKKA